MTLSRRDALLMPLLAALSAACGGAPAKAPQRVLPPMHLRPVSDLAAAASLAWIVDGRPSVVFADPEMVIAVRELFSDAQFDAFAKRHGGVDLRRVDELVIASYPGTTLFLVHGVFDPARVEAAFVARARVVEGRGVDRKSDALGTIVRTWGIVSEEHEQMAIFGHEAIGLEVGKFGPLRASEAFAQEKLKKALPALRAQPLSRASEVLASSPVRMFAPGPFEGDAKKAFGGLLGASTAAAIGVDVMPEGKLRARLVLVGGWSADDAEPAKTRLAAAVNTVLQSALGKLCGVDQPIAGPTVALVGDALICEVTVRALPLFRGLQTATGASPEDFMRY